MPTPLTIAAEQHLREAHTPQNNESPRSIHANHTQMRLVHSSLQVAGVELPVRSTEDAPSPGCTHECLQLFPHKTLGVQRLYTRGILSGLNKKDDEAG